MYKIWDTWELHSFDTVSSTNDVAIEIFANSSFPKVILAKEQTGGRGRMGRSWISCDGNLYMSQILISEIPIWYFPFICSLSIINVLKFHNSKLNAQIKWPNDILIDGKKLAGILIENFSDNKIVIGIGVNLCASPAAESLPYPACNLKDYGIIIEKETFIKEYLKFFNDNAKIALNDFASIRRQWLNHSFGLGKEIEVKSLKTSEKGVFFGIDENGFLLLKKEKEIVKISAGDIFL